ADELAGGQQPFPDARHLHGQSPGSVRGWSSVFLTSSLCKSTVAVVRRRPFLARVRRGSRLVPGGQPVAPGGQVWKTRRAGVALVARRAARPGDRVLLARPTRPRAPRLR